jgi:hypothetical protein
MRSSLSNLVIRWLKPTVLMLVRVGTKFVSELAVQIMGACITAKGATKTK